MDKRVSDDQGLSIISCLQCRTKKIKCGRDIPKCHGCEKKGCLCEYPETNRKTSTRLNRKRKFENIRFYGLNSVNHAFFTANKAFVNSDYELETKKAREQMKIYFTTTVFKKYMGNRDEVVAKIEKVENSLNGPLYAEVIEFSSLKQVLKSSQRISCRNLLLIYSLLILSGRFETTKFTEIKSELLVEFEDMVHKAPDSRQKVVSLLFLSDHYHFNGDIELASKSIFHATSISYALGLHQTPSKLWTMLLFYDSMVCSIIGRPTSIHKAKGHDIQELCEGFGAIAMLVRDTNDVILEFQNKNWLSRVIDLDEKYNEMIQSIQKEISLKPAKTHIPILYFKLLLVIANRTKLLFPGYTKHNFVKEQLKGACSQLSQKFEEMHEQFLSVNLVSSTDPFFFRNQFPFAYCFCFQGFLLYFVFLSAQALTRVKQSTESISTISTPTVQNRPSIASDQWIISFLSRRNNEFKHFVFDCYMDDIFHSIECLLSRTTELQLDNELGRTFSGPASIEIEYSNTMGDTPNSSMKDPSQISSGNDFAEWVSRCTFDDPLFFQSANNLPYF